MTNDPGTPRDTGGVDPATHDFCQARLLAGAMTLLPPADQARFEAHLTGCAECRADGEQLWPSHGRPNAEIGHVPAALLARWEKVEPQLSGVERELVAGHLSRCNHCQEELTLARPAPAPVPRSGFVPAAGRPAWLHWLMGGLVGACAAAVITVAALRPTAPAPPEGGPQGADGALPWVAPVEARGDLDALVLPAGTPALALVLATPAGIDRAQPARLEVIDPDGAAIAQVAIPAAQLEKSTLLVVVRPSRPFRSGSYEVRVYAGAAHGAGDPVQISRFSLRVE